MSLFGAIIPIFAAVASTALAGAVAPRATFQPVTIKGNAFFAGNDRFYIRGVDYQPGKSTTRLHHQLQTLTIRIYQAALLT